MRIAIYTMGCKVNQCDADTLVSALIAINHEAFHTRDFDCKADVFVVNTCTVTHVSDKKSRQMLRRAKKNNPHALISMCGCMAKNSNAPMGVGSTPKGVDIIPKSIAPVPEGVDFVFDARAPQDFFAKLAELSNAISDAKPQISPNATNTVIFKTRTFIKIQDGCDRFCSYCIVPYVRGELKSRPISEIVAEAQSTDSAEVVLTGIQVAAYGQNTDDKLPNLIKAVAQSSVKRLRLSSIDPWAINDAFLQTIAETPALCPHFHLSLQSGCDATLSRMNRRYTTENYAQAVLALRKINPAVALTTDIIVGFPGETDEDFQQSLNFAKAMQFSQIHVFEYSPRKGTPAAEMPNQVHPETKHTRGKILREVAAVLQQNYLQSQVCRTVQVLFETPQSGLSENYCKTEVSNAGNFTNTIQNVQIISYTENSLKGKVTYGNTKN